MVPIAASFFEWFKAVVPLLAAGTALAGAVLFTNRVSHRYELRRKQREFDLETMRELATIYGQFFRSWKAWNALCRYEHVDAAEGAWTLLNQTVEAEGRLETLLLRIACDRSLSKADINALGALRQAFKTVRLAIYHKTPLDWRSSDHGHYAALKTYAAHTAALVSADRVGSAPDAQTARAAFQQITSNRHEGTWKTLAADNGWITMARPRHDG